MNRQVAYSKLKSLEAPFLDLAQRINNGIADYEECKQLAIYFLAYNAILINSQECFDLYWSEIDLVTTEGGITY